MRERREGEDTAENGGMRDGRRVEKGREGEKIADNGKTGGKKG